MLEFRLVDRFNIRKLGGTIGSSKAIHNALKWIPEADLAGLDQISLAPSFKGSGYCLPSWWMEKADHGFLVSGLYEARHLSRPSNIVLFQDALQFPLPEIIRFRPITTLYFARIVAHEAAHHLAATRGFIFAEHEPTRLGVFEEEMANRYSFAVVKRMKERWYYRMAEKLLRHFSKVHFLEGQQHWKRGQHARAADSWYKAWLLDLENQEASLWFLKAKASAEAIATTSDG